MTRSHSLDCSFDFSVCWRSRMFTLWAHCSAPCDLFGLKLPILFSRLRNNHPKVILHPYHIHIILRVIFLGYNMTWFYNPNVNEETFAITEDCCMHPIIFVGVNFVYPELFATVFCYRLLFDLSSCFRPSPYSVLEDYTCVCLLVARGGSYFWRLYYYDLCYREDLISALGFFSFFLILDALWPRVFLSIKILF